MSLMVGWVFWIILSFHLFFKSNRPAGLSTSSTSGDPSYIRSALRSHSAQQPCQSSGNQSCIRPGFRRKMAAHEDYNYYERSGHEKMKISKSSEARGTYSRSGDNSTHTLHIRPDGRRGVPPIRRYNGSHRASSNRTESLALSGVNSRTSDGDNGWLRRRTSNPRSEIARESCRERLRRPRGEWMCSWNWNEHNIFFYIPMEIRVCL